MSNKANKFRHVNAAQNIATVVVSAFLGFIGFSGIDKIQTYLSWIANVDKIRIEFAFNLLVFALFLLATLHLVFHFSKKQSDAEHAIVILTNLSNQIDDLLSREDQGLVTLTTQDLDNVRQKYESIIQVIPSNSDAEFLKAKRDFQEKERSQFSGLLSPQSIFDANQQKSILKVLVHQSPQVMQILRAIKPLDVDLFLGGGVVRNLVWDYLHSAKTATPVDNVNIVYFNRLNSTKEHDQQIETRLRSQFQNLRWSVKNQARMHVVNDEQPYFDLSDAVSKWPETATAIAVRLTDKDDLEIVSPYGLSDLFRLLVRPTLAFHNRLERVAERVIKNRWQEMWPHLTVIVPTLEITSTDASTTYIQQLVNQNRY